jgi:hypothetical protein
LLFRFVICGLVARFVAGSVTDLAPVVGDIKAGTLENDGGWRENPMNPKVTIGTNHGLGIAESSLQIEARPTNIALVLIDWHIDTPITPNCTVGSGQGKARCTVA